MAACGKENKLMEALQTQSYTKIFLSVHCLSEKNIWGPQQQKFLKNIGPFWRAQMCGTPYSCMRFLQIVWYCSWKLSHSAIMCWIHIEVEWVPFVCVTGYLWLDCGFSDTLNIQTFYCRLLCYQVGSDYASCFPHVLKEILEGLLAWLLLGLIYSTAKWGSLLFLNCGSLINYHFPVQNSFLYFNILQM